MSLHSDLLELARHLANRERRRPRQASLRRSVSAAYYAVFHLLAHEGASLLAKGTGITSLRRLFTRGFAHNEMKKLNKDVARRTWPNNIAANVGEVPIPPELVVVAEGFIELQDKRHAADYDILQRFTRSEVEALLDQAGDVFRSWAVIRRQPAARIYLVALFAGSKFKS